MIVFENIGKKILALRRMLDDVKSFSALMLIFMIAYGTVSQGFPYKNIIFQKDMNDLIY